MSEQEFQPEHHYLHADGTEIFCARTPRHVTSFSPGELSAFRGVLYNRKVHYPVFSEVFPDCIDPDGLLLWDVQLKAFAENPLIRE